MTLYDTIQCKCHLSSVSQSNQLILDEMQQTLITSAHSSLLVFSIIHTLKGRQVFISQTIQQTNLRKILYLHMSNGENSRMKYTTGKIT